MKKSIFITLLAISFITTFSACSNSTPKSSDIETKADEKAIYTCTMHPKVRKDKPGDCPICGMALVKMEAVDNTQMHNHSDTMHGN
jgi:Cu(I)/Ag(I) efflux system membrane fusion protein